jgi:hypothetical protein
MQFQVPQFIEVEDKIFGPLTFKQFIYMVGGAGMCYLLWRFLPLLAAAPLMLVCGGFAVSLAFFQFNGRPFILAMEHGFYYVFHPKLYLWNNERKPAAKTALPLEVASAGDVYVPRLSESKLHELAWSLDIKEKIDESRGSHREDLSEVTAVRTARDARVI